MDLQDKISMGTALFGSSAIDRGASTALAEVASNAKDGEVTVYMKDENGNEQKITIPCDGDLREGDTATVIIQEGTATAISASGAGERSKRETAAAQETATDAQNTAEDAATKATTAQTTAENAASAATTAQTTAENAASAATAAQKTAEDAASAASTAKDKATTAASTAQQASEDAKAAADKAEKEAQRAQDAEKKITDNVDKVQKTADQAVSDIADEVTRAQDKEKEIEDLANTASSAASSAQSSASQAAKDAQAAGVSASLAQAAAEAAQGTADKTKKYFYHDSEGAHVISGDETDPTRLDLSNESLIIREGGTDMAEFAADTIMLNKGYYRIKKTEGSYASGQTGYKTETWFHNTGQDQTESSFMFSYDYKDGGGETQIGRTSFLHSAAAFTSGAIGLQGALTTLGIWLTEDSTTQIDGNKIEIGNNKDYKTEIDIGTSSKGATVKIGGSQSSDFIDLTASSIKANGNNIALLAYPVGSIYMSVNSTSPATLFGGTWQQLQNSFLVGAGSSYTAGSTGGNTSHSHTVNGHSHTMSHTHTVNSHSHSMTHTHSISSHTHSISGHTHSIASHTHTLEHTHTYGLRMGAHYSAFVAYSGSNYFQLYNGSAWNNSNTGASDQTTVSFNSVVAGASGNTSKKISRPSLTSNTSAASTSTTSGTSLTTGSAGSGNTGGTSLTTGAASSSSTGTASPSTGAASSSSTGSASPSTNNANNLPPYLAVYMWKRTA